MDSTGIIVFNGNMTRFGLCLPLSTVIHFTSLSKFFNNRLNNPKSYEGWNFWRMWAVKNGGIKLFKGPRINYKYKLMLKVFRETEMNVKAYNLPCWQACSKCKNCGKESYPDNFNFYYYNNVRFCNCEYTDSDTKIAMIERVIDSKQSNIDYRKKELLLQVQRLDEKRKVLEDKRKKLKSIKHFPKMKKAFSNVKENDRYKKTRKQAELTLRKVNVYDDYTKRVRRNLNYKPPLGAGLGV